MQFDRTHVAVRPRSTTEICDLALLVVRQYFRPLLLALSAGIVPLALLNAALLSWLPLEVEYEYDDFEVSGGRVRYVWLMGALIFLETPLAGIFATHYIGQAVFERRPPWRQVFREVFSITHRWFLILGILRGPLPAIGLLLWVWNTSDEVATETVFLLMLVTLVAAVRAFRPYVVEILLLERCPIVSRDKLVLSVGRRSRLLHSPVSNDCFSRFVTIGMMAILFVVAVFFALIHVRGVFAQRWSYSALVQILLVPTSMWIVAAFTIVIRFLAYLDSRIRLEGWDVELGVRAEALRQFGDATHPQPTAGGVV